MSYARRGNIPRAEIWSALKCDSGERVCFASGRGNAPFVLKSTRSLDSTESLTFSLPPNSIATPEVAEGRIWTLWRSDTDYEEWPIGANSAKRASDGRLDVTCPPLIERLGEVGLITDYLRTTTDGLPVLYGSVSGWTAEQIIQAYIIDHPEISALLPWLTLGTIEPTQTIDLQWENVSPLALVRLIVEALRDVKVQAELTLERNGTTSYDLSMYSELGSTAPKVPVRVGRNIQTIERTSDPAERANRIMPRTSPLNGIGTYVGLSRWLVDATNTGAKTADVVDPAGGPSPVGFADQLNGLIVYVEKLGTATNVITDSAIVSTTVGRITLTDALDFDVGDYLQFRRTPNDPATDDVGEVPYYLDHPTYIANTPPGIGVKFRTIPRDNLIAVPNLAANAVMAAWPSGDLPTGYTKYNQVSVGQWEALSDPGNTLLVTSKETDELFWRLGGQSLAFEIPGAGRALVTPPIRYTPGRINERWSARVSILFDADDWYYDASTGHLPIFEMALGVLRADGSLAVWPEKAFVAVPFGTQVATNNNGVLVSNVAGGSWAELELRTVDISTPSSYVGQVVGPPKVTQADLDDNLGYVLAIIQGVGSSFQAWLDAVMIASWDVSPPISEFGKANVAWQSTNQALGLLAIPQVSIAASVVDLERLDPVNLGLTDKLVLGGTILVTDVDPPIELLNTPLRIIEIEWNHLVPGETRILIQSRKKRLADLLFRQAQLAAGLGTRLTTAEKTAAAGTGSSGTGGKGGGGGAFRPTLALDYVQDGADFIFTGTVSPDVVSVKFASDDTAYPDEATVRAQTADTDAPFQVTYTPPIGSALYVSAFAYNQNGVESLIARLTIPVVEAAPLTSPATITIDSTKCGSADTTDYVFVFSTTNRSFKSVANGGEVGNVNDFRFATDSGGSTLKNWEIVQWDAATGLLVARVKLSTLTFATDTVLYLLWDGTGRGSFLGGSAGSVWNSNYKTSYGFGDGTTLDLSDLTTNGNTATNHNGATAAAGPNGLGAVQFVKLSSQYLSSANTINIANATIECFFKMPLGTTGSHGLIGFSNGYNTGTDDKDLTWNGGTGWYVFDGGPKSISDPSSETTGVWHHAMGTADSTTQRLYIDGIQVASQAAGATYTGYTVPNLFVGGGFRTFASSDAAISEARVSDVARSASYAAATYNNIFDPSTFYTIA